MVAKNYYGEYEQLYSETVTACECISSHKSSILSSEVSDINSMLSKLNLRENWQDKLGASFSEVIEKCNSAFKNIISSIDTTFAQGEENYNLLKTTLENLKKANENYKAKVRLEPHLEISKYKIETTLDGQISITYDHSHYNSDHRAWEDEVESYRTQCENLNMQVKRLLLKLNSLNISGLVTFISQPDLSAINVKELFPYTYIQAPTGSVSDFLKANGGLLTAASYYGANYAVVANLTGLPKQRKEGECFAYASDYVNRIYQATGRRQGTTHTYTSSNKQEVLNIAATEITNGRPVIVIVNGLDHRHGHKSEKYGTTTITTMDCDGQFHEETAQVYSRHFIVLNGIKTNVNMSEGIKESDFLALEVTTGRPKPLATNLSKDDRRELLNSQAATYRPSGGQDNQYVIITFDGGADTYVSDSCSLTVA